MSLSGVYKTTRQDGSVYYRSSITFRGKHISLGSYDEEIPATNAYSRAKELLNSDIKYNELSIADILDEYQKDKIIRFDKFISIINFRDNKIYFKNPIYMCKRFFYYFLSENNVFTFDIEDLFYYSSHKIAKRGNHLFSSEFGSQINILSRYGIFSNAVSGRDYIFLNGDVHDFRYENIKIINRYFGVTKVNTKNGEKYRAKILINGPFTIGTYDTEEEAAVAYNKAAEIITKKVPEKNYRHNYIDSLTKENYIRMYLKTVISSKITDYNP